MIDEEATFEKFGYRSTDLKPKSNKPIVCVCDSCREARIIWKHKYKKLCKSCAAKIYHSTPEAYKKSSEAYKKSSEAQLKSYRDHPERAEKISITNRKIKGTEEYRNKVSNVQLKSHRENPERAIKISKSNKKYYDEHPEKRQEKSEAAKARNMSGNDIVNHHYIYDHSDLLKYTTKVTRSKHAKIHAWMRKAGIKVPHINVRGNYND